MPEINQVMFSNRELLELLIRKADVHEGRWILSVTFGFSAGNFGPTDAQMGPGAVTVIQQIGIQRAPADAPPAMGLDAAQVNPPSSA